MLRKFKISIDGKEYLVEMEEIGGVPQPAPAAPQQELLHKLILLCIPHSSSLR